MGCAAVLAAAGVEIAQLEFDADGEQAELDGPAPRPWGRRGGRRS
jgi:hypothetical protein